MARCIKMGGGGGAVDTSDLTATSNKVLSSYTFYGSGSDDPQTGTLTIPANSIRQGSLVGGVMGTWTGDGTTTADKVLTGYTYSNATGSNIAGTMRNNGSGQWSWDAGNEPANSRMWARLGGRNGCYWASGQHPYNYISYDLLRSRLGITADKITAGNTIAGCAGTAARGFRYGVYYGVSTNHSPDNKAITFYLNYGSSGWRAQGATAWSSYIDIGACGFNPVMAIAYLGTDSTYCTEWCGGNFFRLNCESDGGTAYYVNDSAFFIRSDFMRIPVSPGNGIRDNTFTVLVFGTN